MLGRVGGGGEGVTGGEVGRVPEYADLRPVPDNGAPGSDIIEVTRR